MTKSEMAFQRKQLPFVFVHFAWTMLLPPCGLAILLRDPWFGLAALFFFGVFAAVNLASRGITKSIAFDSVAVEVVRTNRRIRIPVDSLHVTEFTMRGLWGGLRVRGAADAGVAVWRHEFPHADWHDLRVRLLASAIASDTDSDWLGIRY